METKFNSEHCCSLTDIGLRRKNNEDVSLSIVGDGGVLLLVADGMGGHRKGEVASGMVKDVLKHEFKVDHRYNSHSSRRFLRKNFKDANKAIYRMSLSGDQFLEMGTTAVAAIVSQKETQIASVGDSRCYIIDNENKIVQVTKDQSYVQMLFDAGKINKSEMYNHPQKNILTNSVGINPDLANLEEFTLSNDSYRAILLCSDGLYNMIRDDVIQEVLCEEKLTTAQKAKKLIELALASGGSDNIAVSLWEK